MVLVAQDDKMNNKSGCRRKRLWPNLRYYPGMCLEGLKKSTKYGCYITQEDFHLIPKDLLAIFTHV
jgi:hypothetical protein